MSSAPYQQDHLQQEQDPFPLQPSLEPEQQVQEEPQEEEKELPKEEPKQETEENAQKEEEVHKVETGDQQENVVKSPEITKTFDQNDDEEENLGQERI